MTELHHPVILAASLCYANNALSCRGRPVPGLRDPEVVEPFRRLCERKALVVSHSAYMNELPSELFQYDGAVQHWRDVFIAGGDLLDQLRVLDRPVVIYGNSELYRAAWPHMTHLWLARVITPILNDADDFFPEFDWDEFDVLENRHEGKASFFHLARRRQRLIGRA